MLSEDGEKYNPGYVIREEGDYCIVQDMDSAREVKMPKSKVEDLKMNPPKFDGVEGTLTFRFFSGF